jgi:hypothetical protein
VESDTDDDVADEAAGAAVSVVGDEQARPETTRGSVASRVRMARQ